MPTVPAVLFGISGVFQELPDAVVAIDLATKRIVSGNAAAERMFDLTPTEIVGSAFGALTLNQDSNEQIAQALGRLASPGNEDVTDRVSFLARRKDRDGLLVDATFSKFFGVTPNEPIAIAVMRPASVEPAPPEAAGLVPEIARVLLNTTDEDAALSEVARLVIPALADLCSIFILEPDLTVRQVTVAHRDSSIEQISRLIHSRYPPKISGARGTILTLLEGKPTIVNQTDDDFFAFVAPDERQRLLLRRLNIKSFMAVPLLARGHVLGAFTFSSSRPDRYRASDLSLAEALASVAALAVDGYRQHRAAQAALSQLNRAQQELAHNQKLRALGQMASGIAHDVNNSLSMILGLTELVLNRSTDFTDVEGPRGALLMIQKTAEDAGQTVRGLREFYRPVESDASMHSVDVSEIVEQAARLTRPRWRDQALARGVTIRVETYLADVPLLPGRDADLRQVMTNLIFNSVDAMSSGGIIVMRTRVDGEEIVVEVSDSGDGMTEEVRRHCLDPYFTTKGSNGSGLGLPMVMSIAERHGGRVSIDSALGVGTTVSMRLPFPRRVHQAGPVDGGGTTERDLKLLLIGFSGSLRDHISPALAGDGHNVVIADSGDAGVKLYSEGGYDAVLLDADVETSDASTVAVAIRAINPLVPIVLVESSLGAAGAPVSVSPPIDAVVVRPLTLRAVRRALAQVGLT